MAVAAFGSEGGTVRIALAVVLPVLAALLQASLAPALAVGGIRPNLPVLLAGSWAVAAGATEGVYWAFVGGLAADLLSGGPLGALALSSLPAVAAIGLGERSPSRSTSVIAAAALVGVAALAAGLGYVAILAIVGQPLPELSALVLTTVGGAVFTGVLALAVYPGLRALRRVTERESPF